MMVKCTSIYGGKVSVNINKLTFRPSAYGIILNQRKILMLTTRSNGKLFFPGGGVKIGERLEEGLVREVKEETGLKIRVKKLLHFKEQYFYYNPKNKAYHMLCFFYLCQPLGLKVLADEDVNDEEAEKPRWLDIEEVRKIKNKLEAVNEIFKLI